MNCTKKSKNGNCIQLAAMELEWTEQICLGWQVNRVYCQQHGEDKMKVLTKRNVPVDGHPLVMA